MKERERLSSRRRAITGCVFWPLDSERAIHVTVGLNCDGRVLEIFARGGGCVDSAMDVTVDDAAVLVSRALQFGDRLENMAHGIGRLPDGSASSIVGAIIDKALELERSLQVRTR